MTSTLSQQNLTMKLALDSLPEEIFLEIALYIAVTDLLSLKQTSRNLYTLGSLDYLWHRSLENFELPLDLPPYRKLSSFSGSELQRAVIKAFKLADNWQKSPPAIKRWRLLPWDNSYGHSSMLLLQGATWLVTARRNDRLSNRVTTTFSFWSLQDRDDIYRRVSFEAPLHSSFCAILEENTNSALLASAGSRSGQEVLDIYRLDLTERFDESPPQQLLTHSNDHRLCYNISIHGDIVAAMLWGQHGPPDDMYHLLFINSRTGVKLTIPFHSFGWTGELLEIRVVDGCIALLIDRGNFTALCIHALPPIVVATQSPSTVPVTCESMCPTLAEYRVVEPAGSSSRGRWKLESSEAGTTLTDRIHFALLRCEPLRPRVEIVRISLKLTTLRDHCLASGVHKYVEVSPDCSTRSVVSYTFSVEFGATGQRAVWLEYQYEGEDVSMQKTSSANPCHGNDRERPGSLQRGVLLPPQPDSVPFVPKDCGALAFDEVTGRLCVSLVTGEFYLVEFV